MPIPMRAKPTPPVQAPAQPEATESKSIKASSVSTGGIRRREVKPAIVTEEFEVTGELANVVAAVKKQMGANIIRRASSPELDYGRLASGILVADLCLGGGLRLSRGSMIYGNKSAGKSTVAGRFVAAAQRAFPDMEAVYIDIEGTLDKPWMARQGVNLDRLHLVEPESGEQAVDIADAVIRANNTSIVISDSIAMLVPMKEIQGSSEDSFPAIQARLVGTYLRKLNASLIAERHRGHTPIILHLNQFRMALNVMFGDPRVLPGGKALEFSTSQQIEISNKEHTSASEKKAGKDTGDGEKGTKVLYNEHRIKITKDKTGGRYKEGVFTLNRDESTGLPVGYVNQSTSIRNFGLECGILVGSPQSFGFSGDSGFHTNKNFRGQPEFLSWLTDDIERERAVVSAIVETYRQAWGIS